MKRMQFGQAWKSRLRKEVWFQGIIALVWTSCSLFAGYLTLRILIAATPELLQVVTRSANPISVIPAIGTITVIAIAAWLAISAVATLVDIAWQKAAFRKRNRMSHKEIEDEYKESEGDPQHKAKRKEFHREILSGGAVRAMTEASVLVRNPIHLAIALKYDPDVVDAPVVAAAGKGESARRLLKLARAQGIPEVTDPPTARSLIHVKVGSPIPDELFEPVAVIFRWLQQEQEGDNLAYGLDSPERESTRT
jgi:flagellar biosynthetic protein FlhB